MDKKENERLWKRLEPVRADFRIRWLDKLLELRGYALEVRRRDVRYDYLRVYYNTLLRYRNQQDSRRLVLEVNRKFTNPIREDVVENMLDAIDKHGIFKYCNERLIKLLNLSEQELDELEVMKWIDEEKRRESRRKEKDSLKALLYSEYVNSIICNEKISQKTILEKYVGYSDEGWPCVRTLKTLWSKTKAKWELDKREMFRLEEIGLSHGEIAIELDVSLWAVETVLRDKNEKSAIFTIRETSRTEEDTTLNQGVLAPSNYLSFIQKKTMQRGLYFPSKREYS